MIEYDFYFSGRSIIVEGAIRRNSRKKKLRTVRFLVDTGAERTTVSLDLLKEIGYEDILQRGLTVKTANHLIDAYTVELISLEVLGLSIQNCEVVAHEISFKMPFEAILGMDFFEDKEFCIDTINEKIKFHN
jgi:predicted aspartyl protease